MTETLLFFMDEKDWDYAKGFESTCPKKKKIICYIIGIGLFTAIMLGYWLDPNSFQSFIGALRG